MMRFPLVVVVSALVACDPDGNWRPATDPTGTDTITSPVVAVDPPAPGSSDDLVTLVHVPAETLRSGTIRYTSSWLRDGERVADLEGAEWVPAESTAVGEVWTLEVVAAIDEIVSDVSSDQVAIENGAPILSLSLEPSQPGTDDEVVSNVEADDPDSEDLVLSYAWYLDGILTDHAGTTLPADATARDESWQLQLQATDPHGASDEAWAETTIENSAPSVLGAVISPSVFTSGETLSCSAVGFEDPDGDAAANIYAWFVDGVQLRDAEEASLDTSGVSGGELVRCAVTASDGDLAGNTVSSAEVEADNTAPTAPEVYIEPAEPAEGEGLQVHFMTESEDVDGDEVVYINEWTVDGSWYGEDVVVPGEDVQAGQTWEISVTPTDGDLEGEPGTASVTVGG